MRKLMTVLGIVFFTSALALPVFARGPGDGARLWHDGKLGTRVRLL